MDDKLTELENRIREIESRNRRVEIDKEWENSYTRAVLISIITYIMAALVLFLIGANNYWLSAFIPVVGFLLSTLTIPAVKSRWINRK